MSAAVLLCAGCGRMRDAAPAPDYGRLSPAELQARGADGKDAGALRELAYRAIQDHQPVQALDYVSRALAREPNSPDAYNLRGMVYADSGRTEAAVADFKRAAALAPAKAGPRLNLGRLYLSQGQHQAAAEAFQSALTAAPRSADAALQAADAWRLAGARTSAKRYYRKALELRPNDAKACAGLGEVLADSGRFGEARESLARARELGDSSAHTRGYLGLASAAVAATPAEAKIALDHLLAARAAGEKGSPIYYGLGIAYFAAHDYARAEQTLKEGIRRFPDVVGLYYTLADVYAATGRIAESRAARTKSGALAAARIQEQGR